MVIANWTPIALYVVRIASVTTLPTSDSQSRPSASPHWSARGIAFVERADLRAEDRRELGVQLVDLGLDRRRPASCRCSTACGSRPSCRRRRPCLAPITIRIAREADALAAVLGHEHAVRRAATSTWRSLWSPITTSTFVTPSAMSIERAGRVGRPCPAVAPSCPSATIASASWRALAASALTAGTTGRTSNGSRLPGKTTLRRRLGREADEPDLDAVAEVDRPSTATTPSASSRPGRRRWR